MDRTLAAAYSCTSCHEGRGLQTLCPDGECISDSLTGKCVECDPSCGDCRLGGNPNSCSSCAANLTHTVLDQHHLTGTCSNSTCPGCVSRSNAIAECGASQFVPVVMGETADDDMGKCKSYTDDCTAHCAPEDDADGLPARRECIKMCYQKMAKRNAYGDKKLVVCKVLKQVTCQASSPASMDNLEGIREDTESCSQEKSAECAAVLPWSEAAATMSAHSIVVLQQEFSMDSSGYGMPFDMISGYGASGYGASGYGASGDGASGYGASGYGEIPGDLVVSLPAAPAVGCDSFGDEAAVASICESTLLMF